MKIDKSGIKREDHDQATRILNKLRMQEFMFGNPAEGLKKTLMELEKKKDAAESGEGWVVSAKELRSDIAKTKAGINGEEDLASFLQKLIKNDPKLDGSVVFTSLSANQEDLDEDLGYIPDSDFLLVHGQSILILDAKAITTSPEMPIYIHDGILKAVNKDLFEVKPSTYVWRNYLDKKGVKYDKIHGCMVIINKNGCTIWKNDEWYKSDARPVYIAELQEFLEEWVDGVDNKTVSLNMLTQIANTQIRKPSSGIDLSKALKKFKV